MLLFGGGATVPEIWPGKREVFAESKALPAAVRELLMN
jgi:hypothetical protein